MLLLSFMEENMFVQNAEAFFEISMETKQNSSSTMKEK